MSNSAGRIAPVRDRTAQTPLGTIIPDDVIDERILATIKSLPWAPDARDVITFGRGVQSLQKTQMELILECMVEDGILYHQSVVPRKDRPARWVYFLAYRSDEEVPCG